MIDLLLVEPGHERAAPLNNRLGVLSTVLEYAHENKLIAKSSLRCHVDSMDAEIVAVPATDVRKLLDAATDQRYRVALLLASEAGLRIGEIRGLQWTDIKGGRITIRRAVDTRNNVGPPKHNKRRAIGLSPALTSALRDLPRRGLWVIGKLDDGGMLGYWAMLDALHAIYTLAGVDVPVSETGATMPWHSLRHSFGTELAARNVPLPQIQKLMGHESIETTMRYVTVTEAQLDDAIATAFGQQAGNESADRPQAAKM